MRLILFTLLQLALLAYLAHADVVSNEDGTGHKVATYQDSKRIVSLSPATTEMLFYIGLGNRLVGRSSYCNYPAAAQELPSVGGFIDTSLEKIVALKPDLVVAYQGNNLELIGQLRKLKIEVLALQEAPTLEEIGIQMNWLSTTILSAGDAHARSKGAFATQESWLQRLSLFSQNSTQITPSVFYGMPGEVTYTAAPGSFINDLIMRAGGRNVVPKGNERWPQVGPEFILAAQPDWLLISTPCTGHTELSKASSDIRASLVKDPVWSKLKAVQHNHIVVINADVLLRPGPRILDALDQLHAALHGGGK